MIATCFGFYVVQSFNMQVQNAELMVHCGGTERKWEDTENSIEK